MPIDPKAGLEYLGFDPEAFDDVDAFKTAADSIYVRRELAHTDKEIHGKALGKTNNLIRGNLKSVAKDFAIEGIDFDTLDPTEGVKLFGKAVKDNFSKLTGEVEALKKGGGSSKDIADLQAKLDSMAKENEAFKADASKWQTEATEIKGKWDQYETTKKVDAFYDDAFKGLKFREDLTPFAIDGFKTAVRQSYKPDFYDGGVRVLDKEGKIVMDPAKAQTYRNPQDIVKEWAEKEKLIGAAAAPAVKLTRSTTAAGLGVQPTQTTAPAQPGRRERTVMPV